MLKKVTILLILPIISLTLLAGCEKPQVAREEFSEIDITQEPVQVQISAEPIPRKIKDGEVTITPLAKYAISAVVVGKKSYSNGWTGEIAPVDIALVWGRLADPKYDKYISYGQSDRWYFYEYKPESPFTNQYIITHSANNHIIPANENIHMAIKAVSKKEKVHLEGYLVKITGHYKGGNVWWNSSLTRSDSGDGSCEVFYVKSVKIGYNVYE